MENLRALFERFVLGNLGNLDSMMSAASANPTNRIGTSPTRDLTNYTLQAIEILLHAIDGVPLSPA
jgi:hypothetical protein